MDMPNFDLFPKVNGVKNFGWAGPKAAHDAWEKVKGNFSPFRLEPNQNETVKKKSKRGRPRKAKLDPKLMGSVIGEGRKRDLWRLVRKVLNKDLINYAQQAGSCVSEGARSTCNYLSCTNIALLNKSEKFRPSYAPYHYGTSRVFIGAKYGVNFGYNDDGSIGSFMAEAIQEYGNLFADVAGLLDYTGQAKIARDWGYRPGPKKEYVEEAKKYLVKKAARITNWNDFVTAIVNGYPIHYCSMLSFQMQPNSKGFHEQTNEGWAHCGEKESFIYSYNGKQLQDIVVGDMVFGHDGKRHKVTEVIKTKFEGKLIKISSGGQHIKITPNHPILAYVSQENDISQYRDVDLTGGVATIPVTKTKLVAKWMKASELKEGDFLVCPGFVFEKTENFPKFVVPNDGQKRNIPKDLFIDDDIAWFFGMYAGDGNSCPEGHKVRITLSSKEYDKATRCVKALNKLGLPASIKPVKNKNAIRVICYSSILAQFMAKEFGKRQDKHLPDWIFTTGLNLREVANCLFESDGKNISQGENLFYNNRKVLVYQLYMILISLGEKPRYTNEKNFKKPRNPMYSIRYNKNSNETVSRWVDNNYLTKITNISEYYYNDYVYNLEVEDAHSYLLEGTVSHNCMTHIGVNDEHKDPYVLILNSWGDVHGQLYDFDTNEKLPVGVLRVRKSVIEKDLRNSDTEAFAWSDMDGFYERKKEIDTALFDLFG